MINILIQNLSFNINMKFLSPIITSWVIQHIVWRMEDWLLLEGRRPIDDGPHRRLQVLRDFYKISATNILTVRVGINDYRLLTISGVDITLQPVVVDRVADKFYGISSRR